MAAGLALAFATYVAYHARLLFTPFLEPDTDHAWLLALALRSEDSSLYSGDEVLLSIGDFYPPFFIRVLALWARLFGSHHGAAFWTGSVGMLLAFFVGHFFLGRRLTGTHWGGAALALLSLRPHTAFLSIYGIFLGEFYGQGIGAAVFPWLLWALLGARTPASFLAVGAASGAVALATPWVALQFALLASVALLASGTPPSRVAGLAAGFAPPFVLSTALVQVGMGDPPDLEVVRQTASLMLGPSWNALPGIAGTFILPSLLAASAGTALWRSPDPGRRFWRCYLLAGVAFWASSYIVRVVPSYFLAFPGRAPFSVFSALLGAGAVALAQARRPWVAGLFLLNLAVTDLRLPAPRGPGLARERVARAGAYGGPSCRKEFVELGRWAQTGTPKEDLFLVEPRGMAHFRFYARRGIVASRYDLAAAYRGRSGRAWAERLREATRAYTEGPAALREVALRYRASWIVTLAQGAPPGPAVFENRCYKVVQAGAPAPPDPG